MPKKGQLKRTPDYSIFESLDKLIENVKIPEKTWLFYQNYTSPDSKTVGIITKSYLASGYQEHSGTKWAAMKLFNSKLFQKLLELHKKKEYEKRDLKELSVLESTDKHLVWLIHESQSKKDLATFRAAVMDRAKLHGLLADRTIISTDDPLHLPDSVRRQALQEAHKLLLEGDVTESLTGDDDNTIDAEFVDETGDSGQTTDDGQIDDSFLLDDDSA